MTRSRNAWLCVNATISTDVERAPYGHVLGTSQHRALSFLPLSVEGLKISPQQLNIWMWLFYKIILSETIVFYRTKRHSAPKLRHLITLLLGKSNIGFLCENHFNRIKHQVKSSSLDLPFIIYNSFVFCKDFLRTFSSSWS